MGNEGREKLSYHVIHAFLAALLLFMLSPSQASAVTSSGESRTYLQLRETSGSDTYAPLYEYLNLNLEKIGGKDVSLYFGGWLSYDLADESFNKRYDNELQYFYLSISEKSGSGTLKLGRFYVFEGVAAAEQVDGLYAQQYIGGRLGISVYGGVPRETSFDNERSGDYIYGGRISDGIPGIYTLGVSYLKESNQSDDFREEAGVDLWLRMTKKLELQGHSFYNVETSGWQEHWYYLTLGPLAGLSIRPQFSSIDYEHYFTAVKNSAFSFTPSAINPKEKMQMIGGELEYAFSKSFLIAGDYKNYNYDIAGDAHYYGGKIAYLAQSSDYTKKGSFGAAFHRMDGDTKDLQYDEYRGYGSINFGKIDFAVDLLYISYDQEIDGEDVAYSAAGSLGLTLSKSVRLAGDVEYGKNPEFDEDVRGFVKLLYRFGS